MPFKLPEPTVADHLRDILIEKRYRGNRGNRGLMLDCAAADITRRTGYTIEQRQLERILRGEGREMTLMEAVVISQGLDVDILDLVYGKEDPPPLPEPAKARRRG